VIRHPLCPGEKVLVTGARGFLGSHLCGRLIECGAEVHAISRSTEGSPSKNLRWWQVDLEDIVATKNLFSRVKPDVIYHLSGHVTADPDIRQVLPTFRSLLLTTVQLLTIATEIGCRRVVLTASLTEPQTGQFDSPPGSPYAAAKWASNAFGRMFQKLYHAPVVIVRPFMVFGPNQNQTKLVPYSIRSLIRGEQPKLASGEWRADWIYVDDVTDGLLAAAEVTGIEGSTIDLGSGQLVKAEAIIRQIIGLLGSSIEPHFGALPDRPSERIRVADLEHTLRVLGWQPKTSLSEGLRKTVNWHLSSEVSNRTGASDCVRRAAP
jgi:UDP-glucose 4-epimerase